MIVRPVLIGAALLAALGLAACTGSSSNAVDHVDIGDNETHAAQTVAALPTATPTPGPSLIPTATLAPFVIPTNEPDVDGDTIITRVGSQNITLAEFQKHVRFERWVRLYQLAQLVERQGIEKILDLRDPQNATVASLFATLADSNSFGVQVQRVMVIDAITTQEAARRNMSVDPNQFDAKMAQFMGLQVGQNGDLPPEFDAVYADFIAQLSIYTGLTEEEFRDIVRARTLYYQLKFLISQEPEALPSGNEARVGMEVQDIVVDTEAEGQDVIARLQNGEAIVDIAQSYGLTPTSTDGSRVVHWSDQNLTDDIRTALFEADPDTIIGPFPVSDGWYVARVINEVFDVLSPADIQALRDQHFLDWVEAKMDDTTYVQDFQNWEPYIPQEPLPQDVSPLLRTENVILPEVTPAATEELTP